MAKIEQMTEEENFEAVTRINAKNFRQTFFIVIEWRQPQSIYSSQWTLKMLQNIFCISWALKWD